MPKFRITWTAELEASSMVEAAFKAALLHTDPNKVSTIYKVQSVDDPLIQPITLDVDNEFDVFEATRNDPYEQPRH